MSRKHTISKEEIVQAAKNLTREVGFENFSIRNIAEKCGIAIGTIYLYFENKTQLLIEIAADFWNNCLANVSKNLSDDFFCNLKNMYFSILEYLENFKTDWLKGFSELTSSSKNEGKKAMDMYMQKIRSHIETIFAHSKAQFSKQFFEEIDQNYFISFLFSNIMNMLMRFSHNYDAFERIIKKILL